MDPEVNKTLTRDFISDSTTNVVSPSIISQGKVKPGQINHFNPVGMKVLDLSQVYDGPISPPSSVIEMENFSQDRTAMRNVVLQ
jgi:hypothetical protein